MKIISVVGARPNFMKIAPIIKAFAKEKVIQSVLVHTGQHYDKNMSDSIFEDLEIPMPDYNLGVKGGSHAEQTANVMIKFEEVCLKEKPDLVLVVGDVNSTIACALVAKKLHVSVAHVEAGLRSGDRDMPEEINRILTDSISDYLFVTEQAGIDNLKNEGVPDEKVFFVGNVMIDSLVVSLEKIKRTKKLEDLGLEKGSFAVLTLHRPSNVDTKEQLSLALDIVLEVQKLIPLVWPLHPRTKNNIEKFALKDKLDASGIMVTNPLPYLEFMNLVSNAKCILTDSGGIQEETTYLKIPCITLRENTERPSTISLGTNTLLGLEKKTILELVSVIVDNKYKESLIPPLWDGKTAERITEILKN